VLRTSRRPRGRTPTDPAASIQECHAPRQHARSVGTPRGLGHSSRCSIRARHSWARSSMAEQLTLNHWPVCVALHTIAQPRKPPNHVAYWSRAAEGRRPLQRWLGLDRRGAGRPAARLVDAPCIR
jgi:hypothetical protein